MATIAPKYRKSYEENAGPESIAAHIADAKADLRTQERYIQWLEDLLERRIREKEAGTWGQEPLQPGDRVYIDAPRVSQNHGSHGVVESTSDECTSVLLDGETKAWLFARGAVRRAVTEAPDA